MPVPIGFPQPPKTGSQVSHGKIVGLEHEMEDTPLSTKLPNFDWTSLIEYRGKNALVDRKALITGGDSGIGAAVAIGFAREGADVAITFERSEQKDAKITRDLIEKAGRKCVLIPCDLAKGEQEVARIVDAAVTDLNGLDIVVSNAAVQFLNRDITTLSSEQLELTFKVNIFSAFYFAKYSVPHLKTGSSIIFTSSVVAFKGNKNLVDYAATKASLLNLTRSLAQQLAPKGIRVNAVCPGAIYTPLQAVSRDQENLDDFADNPAAIGYVGQPAQMIGAYVLLASPEGSFMDGAHIDLNGASYFA